MLAVLHQPCRYFGKRPPVQRRVTCKDLKEGALFNAHHRVTKYHQKHGYK